MSGHWETIGHMAKSLRETAGMTQVDVATIAGVAVGTVSRLETGKLTPAPSKLADIMKAIGATPEQLDRIGQTEAAEMLRSKPENGNHRLLGLDPVIEAVTRCQMALTDLGWSVTVHRPEPDLIRMELRRGGPV